jgi:hypothetical protein
MANRTVGAPSFAAKTVRDAIAAKAKEFEGVVKIAAPICRMPCL